MAITKQINIKNRTCYFYNDLIKLFGFNPNMLKLDEKHLKAKIFIILNMLQKKNIVNPLYLLIYKIDGFIEEKRGNKYLTIAFTCNNVELLKKYKEVLTRIKTCFEEDGKYYPQAYLGDCFYEL